MRKYYTLLVKERGEPWAIAFGDYSRKVVAQEGRDRQDGHDHVRGTRYTIISTSDKQADIDKAVATLNQRQPLDLIARREGTIFMLSGHTAAGRDFISNQLDFESWAMLGDAVAIDQHCIDGVLEGAKFEHGLTIEVR